MSSASTGSNGLYFGANAPTGTDYLDNASFIVTDDGTPTGTPTEFWKFDEDTMAWVRVPSGGTTCPAPMTRNALLALSGSYNKDCHYVITDYNRGTVGASQIQLHAVNETTLSMDVSVFTAHDNMAWDGVYDINTNRITELQDNIENRVKNQDSVDAFPWGVGAVSGNTVNDGTLAYTAGTVANNTISAAANLIVNGGAFSQNNIHSDANVTVDGGNVLRNTFGHQSNTTVSSGDFRENVVGGDATVTSSTTGDVDNNEFLTLARVIVSGTANVDTVTVGKSSNLNISGGVLIDSTIDQDAEVILVGGTHYENVWGTSVRFVQVAGTSAYVRYSTFEGTPLITHGGVNLSNVWSQVSTINTTGSSGTISNTKFGRAYCPNLQNIPSLTITDCTISNYAQVSASGAVRLYMYRTNLSSAGRMLVTAGADMESRYDTIESYGYIRAQAGALISSYNSVSNFSYIDQNTPGTGRVARCSVASSANIRFLGSSDNCRVYYCDASAGATVYHNNSTGAYMYYCSAQSAARMYTQGSTNTRMYYCAAASRGRMIALNVTGTHYMYYLDVSSNALIRMNGGSGGRLYSIAASAQSIGELRNGVAASRWYYSSVTAYYYLYLTLTGTRTALHGYGRRTRTVTDPANGTAVENF